VEGDGGRGRWTAGARHCGSSVAPLSWGEPEEGWARPRCCCVAVLLCCCTAVLLCCCTAVLLYCSCPLIAVRFLSSVIEVVCGCRPGGRSAALQSPRAGEIERAPCPGLPSITAWPYGGWPAGRRSPALCPASAQPWPSRGQGGILCALASCRTGILSRRRHWVQYGILALRSPHPPIPSRRFWLDLPVVPRDWPAQASGGRLVLVAGLCRDPTCPANSRAPTAPGGTPVQHY
jgi:hypothetical protein